MDNEDIQLRLKCPNCAKDQYPDNLQTNREIKSELDAFIKDHFANLKALALAAAKTQSKVVQGDSVEHKDKKQKVFRVICDKKGYSRPLFQKNAITSYTSNIPAPYKVH